MAESLTRDVQNKIPGIHDTLKFSHSGMSSSQSSKMNSCTIEVEWKYHPNACGVFMVIALAPSKQKSRFELYGFQRKCQQ